LQRAESGIFNGGTSERIVGLAAWQLSRELGVVAISPQWRALGPLRAAEWEQSSNGVPPDPDAAPAQ